MDHCQTVRQGRTALPSRLQDSRKHRVEVGVSQSDAGDGAGGNLGSHWRRDVGRRRLRLVLQIKIEVIVRGLSYRHILAGYRRCGLVLRRHIQLLLRRSKGGINLGRGLAGRCCRSLFLWDDFQILLRSRKVDVSLRTVTLHSCGSRHRGGGHRCCWRIPNKLGISNIKGIVSSRRRRSGRHHRRLRHRLPVGSLVNGVQVILGDISSHTGVIKTGLGCRTQGRLHCIARRVACHRLRAGRSSGGTH
mmetsp:Transcript_23015/g.50612  ORF Transcript_23015/g.50612 Transcript_23015/m.50612 type:complete len:247 (-) Transcript_23015:236-976(-)